MLFISGNSRSPRFIHVAYKMLELRTRQPGRLEILRRLRRGTAPPPEAALADPAGAAASQPRPGRQPVEAPAAKAAAVAIVRPQAINAGKEGERAPSRQEACTEAGAALGLCVAKSVEKKEAAAVEAAIKRPQATGAGNAGGQEPPCTEAVAALGLCAPKPTQRRE